jgi:hypothetical protein
MNVNPNHCVWYSTLSVPRSPSFLMTLLQSSQHKDVTPVVSCAWAILSMAMDVQGPEALVSSHEAFLQMLDPTFVLKHQHAVTNMAGAVRRVFQFIKDSAKPGEQDGGDSESAGEGAAQGQAPGQQPQQQQQQAGEVKADPSGPAAMQTDAPAAPAAVKTEEEAVKVEGVEGAAPAAPAAAPQDAAAAQDPAAAAAGAAAGGAAAAPPPGGPAGDGAAGGAGQAMREILGKLQEKVLGTIMRALVAAQDAGVNMLVSGGVCGVVWCGVVWCGVVWCGVVWCGVVWCGVEWCGVVCC